MPTPEPSDPDFDDTEYPQPVRNVGFCPCDGCHTPGAIWSFRGRIYHDDCAAKAMGLDNATAL